MKITVKTGLIFALIWITMKMIFFYSGTMQDQVVPAVMLNILCLLLAIAVGLYKHKRDSIEESTALSDIKSAMSAGVPYALVVSIFIFIYYSQIHPEFNEHQIAEAEMGIQKMLEDPEALAEVKKSNAEFEVMTNDEIFEQLVQGPRGFYNPTSTMTVSMLAMLLLATLNSIFVTVVYRKVVFRKN